ncbi:MAG: BamA/TamA family outer membrane protein [Saprospirales bacterium]|nr:BamA/TamA family outer membrane protein [Saprospirales bacterium]
MDAGQYDKETSRIVTFLRNRGYAYFSSNYIASLEADSSNFKVQLILEVLLPPNDSIHRTYTVGDLFLYPEFDPSSPTPSGIDTIAPGIYFMGDSSNYKVREKVLLNTLYLKKGDLFSQDNYDRTNRQLSNLGIFRFVTLKAEPDPDIAGQINFRIYLTPNKRFEFGTDLEVNTSNAQFIGRRLLGVSGNVSLRHRNLFKGAELFITNLEGGIDLNLSSFRYDTVKLINTVDVRLHSDLYLPKFVDFFGFYSLLDKMHILRHPFYTALHDRGATRISLSYNYLERIDLFSLNTLNAVFGYDFRPSNRHRYIINHLGIDYLSPRTTFYFDTLILDKNQNLQRTFDKQLFTSFLLRDFSYTYSGLTNRFGESSSFITRIELSGLEVYLANLLYNGLAAPEKRDTFDLVFSGDTIQFSQYTRLEFDFRHYIKLSKGQLLVFRGALGWAIPFGFSSGVPYVKQFYVGGPQSVRAWNARAIGPGGYLDPLTQSSGVNPTLFYQTAEFKLDFNAEYRFPIFTLFGIKYEGALFLDAGNVWTTYPDSTRRFSQLRWTPTYDEFNNKLSDNLFKYIAVGTGFGLRLDFAYFILRLDLGMKLRNPYPQIDDLGNVKEVFWRSPFQNGWSDLNLNLGLGYPF